MALVVAFDQGRARAKKIGPIENPRRHLGVYLIGENLNVLGPHGAGPWNVAKLFLQPKITTLIQR